MEEKGRELGELRDYGKKLLDEMQYKDIIAMVGETITHIADIAEEYSKEAENWRGKYEESARENDNLSKKLTDLTEASDKQIDELRDIIGEQAKKIEGMGHDFKEKMEKLYSHRNAEIDDYNKKAEGLIATQNALEKERDRLEKARKSYEEKEGKCQSKFNDLQRQIEDNQTKIDEYEGLFNYKLNAEKQIAKAKTEANDKIQAANDEWELKYGKEYKLRKELEEKLANLKERLPRNAENNNGEVVAPQDTSSADEEGDDRGK